MQINNLLKSPRKPAATFAIESIGSAPVRAFQADRPGLSGHSRHWGWNWRDPGFPGLRLTLMRCALERNGGKEGI